MNETFVRFLVQSINTFVMFFLCFLFFNKIYCQKYTRKIIYIIGFISAGVLDILINQLQIPILNLFSSFCIINISCILLYKVHLVKSIIYNTMLWAILFLCEMGVIAMWSVIKNETLDRILSNSQYMTISCIINIMLMILAYKLYGNILCKSDIEHIKFKESIMLAVFTIFEILVMCSYIIKINNKSDGLIAMLIILGFLFLNILVIYIINSITKTYKIQYEFQIMQNQSKLQLSNYMEISKKYEESRKTVHDIKKHLATLSMLKNTDDNRASEYSQLIEKQVDSLLNGFQCSNTILSIIMSQKILVAETENIKVGTQVEDITFDFISDIDMTAIFANLWDNAIEACVKIINSEKFINVIIGRVNDFIIISFENSYDGIINKKKNEILSTKKNHDGVGLSIIKSALDKYDGIITMSQDENIFKTEILIPIT